MLYGAEEIAQNSCPRRVVQAGWPTGIVIGGRTQGDSILPFLFILLFNGCPLVSGLSSVHAARIRLINFTLSSSSTTTWTTC